MSELRTIRYIEIGYRSGREFRPVFCMLPSLLGPVGDLFFAKLNMYLMQWHGEHTRRQYAYRHVMTTWETPEGGVRR